MIKKFQKYYFAGLTWQDWASIVETWHGEVPEDNHKKGEHMKTSFDIPDEWGPLLDKLAAKDGHSNRAAVIRKIMNHFFAENLAQTCHSDEKGQEK